MLFPSVVCSQEFHENYIRNILLIQILTTLSNGKTMCKCGPVFYTTLLNEKTCSGPWSRMWYEGIPRPPKPLSLPPVQPRSFCLVSLLFFSFPESSIPGFISTYKPASKANQNLFSCPKDNWQSTPLAHNTQTLLHCSTAWPCHNFFTKTVPGPLWTPSFSAAFLGQSC